MREALGKADSGGKLRLGPRKLSVLIFGFGLLLTAYWISPPMGMPRHAWLTVILAIVMAIYWIVEVVPIWLTALAPILILPLYGIDSVANVVASSVEPGLLVFLGGFVAALAIDHHGIHRRLVSSVTRRLGTSLNATLAAIMLLTACLSMVMSNTTAALLMMPVALIFSGSSQDNKRPSFGLVSIFALGVAHAATIGGMVTLIGTPPNILTSSFLSESMGVEIGFAQWMLISLPIAMPLLGVSWLILATAAGRFEGHATSRASLDFGGVSDSPLSKPEKRVITLLVCLFAAWLTRPVFNQFVPVLIWNDVTISILVSMLFCVLPSGSKAEKTLLPIRLLLNFPWPVLLLFGGGLMLAHGFSVSGLTDWISSASGVFGSIPLWIMVVLFVFAVSILTEFMSNTASAAVLLPISAAVATGTSAPPEILALSVCFAANAAFITPVSTAPNTIAFMTNHLRPIDMMRFGVLLNMAAILIVATLIPIMARAIL